MSSADAYVGKELELFAEASNWKAYVRDRLDPYILGSVAEVGAGIGSTTANLCNPDRVDDWLCVEPDHAQGEAICTKLERGELPGCCRLATGILGDLSNDRTFDTIVYIDVLEHIEDDRGEAQLAFDRLRPGGRLIVLGPAYQYLFSRFDEAVGHHRRFTLRYLRGIAPRGARESAAFYLDSLGLIISLANKLLLKQTEPTIGQIKTWDRIVVPLSRLILDRLTLHKAGRSAVIVWEKAE